MTLCAVESCWNEDIQAHHVTYEPEHIEPLCEKHHRELTVIESQEAFRVHHPLSNEHRWHIFRQFIAGNWKTPPRYLAAKAFAWRRDTAPRRYRRS